MNKFYTSRLVNYVEPVIINSQTKTAFYSDVNTNFNIGDKVFIINGEYDSDAYNLTIDFTKGYDGYKVLDVDRCKIVLDIDWRNKTPYIEDDINQYIRVYSIKTQREFDYFNQIEVNIDANGTSETNRYNKFNYLNQDGNGLTNCIVYSPITYTGTSSNNDEVRNNNGLNSPGFCYRADVYDFNTSIPNGTTPKLLSSDWTNIDNLINNGVLSNGEHNNRLLIIGDDITLPSGDVLRNGNSYYYDNIIGKWFIDINRKPAIISKLIFRDGIFKGNWNDGIFGSYDNRSKWKWDKAIWNSGFVINSDWEIGTINSKSTNSEQSYYAKYDGNNIIQNTDFLNNKGYGYNFFLDSTLIKGTINNGTFENCIVGDINPNRVIECYNNNDMVSFDNELMVNGGLYKFSKIEGIQFKNSTSVFSNIHNTYTENSKIQSTQVDDSVSNNCIIGSTDAQVIVLGADVWSYHYVGPTDPDITLNTSGILKLWINDSDILKLGNLDSIYLTNINKQWILNSTDNDRKVLIPIEGKYILDAYYDKTKSTRDISISIKTKQDNSYKVTAVKLPSSTSPFYIYTNRYTSNDNGFASIDFDLGFEFSYYDDNGTLIFPSGNTMPDYLRKITNGKLDVNSLFNNTSIDVLNYNNAIIDNSTWNYASHDNFITNIIRRISTTANLDISWTNSIAPYGRLIVNIDKDETEKESLKIGDYVHLDSIQYNGVDTYLINETFKITDVVILNDKRRIDLSPLNDNMLTQMNGVGTFTAIDQTLINSQQSIPNYVSLHKTKIINSNIKGGFLRRSLINSCIIKNDEFNSSDTSLSLSNISKLRLINILFKDNGNIVNSGVIYNSHIIAAYSSNITNWNGGIAYKSVWHNVPFNNGVFKESYWLYGEFNNGYFYDCKNYDIISLSFDDIQQRMIWIDGNFNNGSFFNSYWWSGAFNDGKFYKSEFWDGVIYGGIFGDTNYLYSDTKIGTLYYLPWLPMPTDPSGLVPTPFHVTWYNGTSQNALFGGYGRIDWENGIFMGGVFTTNVDTYDLLGNYSIWKNGEFSGSIFSGYARWKNGIFKKGKFISTYGWDKLDSLNKEDYAWENGEFYGEQFGTADIKHVNNSSWYYGEMYNGTWVGSVWNNGILYGGNFNGSGYRKPDTLDTIYPDQVSLSNAIAIRTDLLTLLSMKEGNFLRPITHRITLNNLAVPEHFPSSITNEDALLYAENYTNSFIDQYYGLWRNGWVSDDQSLARPNLPISTSQNKDNEPIENKKVIMKNVMWLDGKFNHQNGTINNSIWLSGIFMDGTSSETIYNPYVDRTFTAIGNKSFETDSNNIRWENGNFDGGIFYMSKWNNGKFLDGVMNSAIWLDGTFMYGWANNTYWKNGIWKNGNWDGSPFNDKSLELTDVDNNPLNPPIINEYTQTMLDYINNALVENDSDQSEVNYIHLNNHFEGGLVNEYSSVYPGKSTFNPTGSMIKPFSELKFVFPNFIIVNNLSQYSRAYGLSDGLNVTSWSNQSSSFFNRGYITNIEAYSNVLVLEQVDPNTWVLVYREIIKNEVVGSLDVRDYNLFRKVYYAQNIPVLNQFMKIVDSGNATTAYNQSTQTTLNPGPLQYISNPERKFYSLDNISFLGNNRYSKYLSPLSWATSNISGTYVFSNTDIFRRLYTNLFTGAPIKYDIEAVVNVAVSHTRPFNSFKPSAAITLQMIAGRKIVNNVVEMNTIEDTFVPLNWDWVSRRTLKLSYNPIMDDIYMGNSSSQYAANKATNQNLNGTIVSGVANDFDKEFTINVYTNGLSYDLDSHISPAPGFFNPYNSLKYDIFEVCLISLKITGVIIDYSSVNNTLWLSYDTNQNKWLLPIDTQATINVNTVRTLGGKTTSRTDLVTIKYGNGKFRSGIWETGAWNQGWRYDNVIKFHNQTISVKIDDYTWSVQLTPVDSDIQRVTSTIKVGDKIAIGNIVGIDINNERKLLINYSVVSYIDMQSGILVAQVSTSFPLRTIEADSTNHIIYVTKNVWLNGAFFNGHFTGVWSYGLIKGFSQITKVQNTQWIDGIFDGGRLLSLTNNTGDNAKKIAVTLLNSNQTQYYSASLIQNFTFYDNNIADKDKFLYDSWIDLIYDETSKSNIMKDYDTTLSNPKVTVQTANITGFPTTDILASDSYFRNTNDTKVVKYRLGTKFKRYKSYMTDNISDFTDQFNMTMQSRDAYALKRDTTNFFNNKWTYEHTILTPNNSTMLINYKGFTQTLPSPSDIWLNKNFRISNEFFTCYFDSSVGSYKWRSNDALYGNVSIAIGTNFDLANGAYNLTIVPRAITQMTYLRDNTTSVADPVRRASNDWVRDRISNEYTNAIEKNRYSIIEYKVATRNYTATDPTNPSANIAYNNAKQYYVPNGNDSVAPSNIEYHPNYKNEIWYVPLAKNVPGAYTGRQEQAMLSFEAIPDDNAMNQFMPRFSGKTGTYDEIGEHIEYFYNKKSLNMTFLSTGYKRFEITFDYVRFTEVDMIPFFKYSNGPDGSIGINKNIVSPWLGIANKDLKQDTDVLGNINISREYLNEDFTIVYNGNVNTQPIYQYTQAIYITNQVQLDQTILKRLGK